MKVIAFVSNVLAACYFCWAFYRHYREFTQGQESLEPGEYLSAKWYLDPFLDALCVAWCLFNAACIVIGHETKWIP